MSGAVFEQEITTDLPASNQFLRAAPLHEQRRHSCRRRLRQLRPLWKGKVESCRSLDVNRLSKAGCLRPGYRGGWAWTADGEQVASIGLRATADQLILNYRVCRNGEDWTDVEEAVPLARSPCRFGGMRSYFVCPGVKNGRPCSRRVTKLYLGGRYFLCRHCYDLAYASQSETRPYRLLRRADKRKIALGGTWDLFIIPPKAERHALAHLPAVHGRDRCGRGARRPGFFDGTTPGK